MERTIFLIDDDQAFLRSTTRLLESEDLPVTAFQSGEEFFENYETGHPGCLLLDLMMPGMSGLDVLEMMRELDLTLPTIVMSAFGNVQSAVRAMKLGALDFVEKPIHNNRELLQLMRSTLSAGLPSQKAQQEAQQIGQRLKLLTERELEILEQVIEGLSSPEIASQFDVSLSTVNTHRANIMKKMEVNSAQNLIRAISHYRSAQQVELAQRNVARRMTIAEVSSSPKTGGMLEN